MGVRPIIAFVAAMVLCRSMLDTLNALDPIPRAGSQDVFRAQGCVIRSTLNP